MSGLRPNDKAIVLIETEEASIKDWEGMMLKAEFLKLALEEAKKEKELCCDLATKEFWNGRISGLQFALGSDLEESERVPMLEPRKP